ncbi:MAG: SCO family protein [Bacteroidetes bacterium]|nr:MAG: SCO family protein [Bacteroidota bacterium]
MKKYAFLLVFALLLIPILWIALLKQGQIVSQQLPVYGERSYSSEIGDTVYHTISDFSFVNQDGLVINQDSLRGKIYVANFFFTTCPDICPSMMKNVQFVYNKYNEAPDIRFISHTVDPKQDSVAALKKYADNLGAQSNRWYLVTGSKAALYFAAEHDYLLAAVETSLEDAFIHSEKLVLIDHKGHIRGFYNGLEFREMRKLVDDIKALVVELQHDKASSGKQIQ